MKVDVAKLLDLRAQVQGKGRSKELVRYVAALVEACDPVARGGGGLLEEVEELRAAADKQRRWNLTVDRANAAAGDEDK